MPITVNELRLSLVWNKVFAQDTNLPSLMDPAFYRTAFHDAAADADGSLWLLPWLPEKSQHFWEYYLAPVTTTNFRQVVAEKARSYFVPLRVPPFASVKALDGTVATFEGFCFPHSTGVVATLRLRPETPLPLGDMVTAAVKARNADYNLTWKDPQKANTHSDLQGLADLAITYLHGLVGIDPMATGVKLPPPITIATVIDAEGEDDGTLEQSLKALCWLRPGWQKARLAFAAEGVSQGVDDKLGAIGKGRCVWLPDRFSATEIRGRNTKLGCYHRNLTLASAQTAAVAALIGRVDQVLVTGGHLLAITRDEAAQGIRLLNLLEEGDDTTYKCWSMKFQASFYAQEVERVSAYLAGRPVASVAAANAPAKDPKDQPGTSPATPGPGKV